MPETMTVAEAARRAGRNERTIRLWLERGHVEFVRGEDGKRRVLRASLDAHIGQGGAAPATDPAASPALAELVAELVQMRRELTDANWRVGYLTAQLEAERQRVRLLEAGPAVDPAGHPAPETSPETLPETVAAPAMPPPTRWGRLRAWLAGG